MGEKTFSPFTVSVAWKTVFVCEADYKSGMGRCDQIITECLQAGNTSLQKRLPAAGPHEICDFLDFLFGSEKRDRPVLEDYRKEIETGGKFVE